MPSTDLSEVKCWRGRGQEEREREASPQGDRGFEICSEITGQFQSHWVTPQRKCCPLCNHRASRKGQSVVLRRQQKRSTLTEVSPAAENSAVPYAHGGPVLSSPLSIPKQQITDHVSRQRPSAGHALRRQRPISISRTYCFTHKQSLVSSLQLTTQQNTRNPGAS